MSRDILWSSAIVQELVNTGYVQRDSSVSDAPRDTREALQDASQVETLKGVIETLQKQLEASSEEKSQLLRQLDQAQALLLNEQQAMQRLLPEAGPGRRWVRGWFRSWRRK